MKEVFGGIIMAIGILIAGGSGLCSLVILFEGGMGADAFSMLPVVLMFGGIPFVIGAGIAFGGYMLFRSGRNDNKREEQ